MKTTDRRLKRIPSQHFIILLTFCCFFTFASFRASANPLGSLLSLTRESARLCRSLISPSRVSTRDIIEHQLLNQPEPEQSLFISLFAWDYFLPLDMGIPYGNSPFPAKAAETLISTPRKPLVHHEILFTKIVQSRGFINYLKTIGAEETYAYSKRVNWPVSSFVRRYLIRLSDVRNLPIRQKVPRLREIENELLSDYQLLNQRKQVANLLRHIMAYRYLFLEKIKSGEIGVWDISIGKLPSVKTGIFTERIEVQPGSSIFLGPYGEATILKFLGSGFEHSVYLVESKKKGKTVLKIAHDPDSDRIKKQEYDLITSSGIPVINWRVQAKGYYVVEPLKRTAEDTALAYVRDKEMESELDSILAFYKSYLKKRVLVADLALNNIGTRGRDEWKVIDWYGVATTRRYPAESLTKMKQLELSIKLQASMRKLRHDLEQSGDWRRKKVRKRWQKLLRLLVKELKLANVRNHPDYLSPVFLEIVAPSPATSTLASLIESE